MTYDPLLAPRVIHKDTERIECSRCGSHIQDELVMCLDCAAQLIDRIRELEDELYAVKTNAGIVDDKEALYWTSEKPQQNGWYLAYESLDAVDADVMFVYVDVKAGHGIYYGQFFELDHFSQWMGPISVPLRKT